MMIMQNSFIIVSGTTMQVFHNYLNVEQALEAPRSENIVFLHPPGL